MLVLTLAQQSKALSFGPYLFVVMGAIAALVLGGLAILYLRRRVMEQNRGMDAAGSFMEALREMRRNGQISEAEYERTRKAMAAKISAKLDTQRSNGLFEMPETRPRPRPPVAPRTGPNTTEPTHLEAPPGYDLTGAPLPKPSNPRPDDAPKKPEPENG